MTVAEAIAYFKKLVIRIKGIVAEEDEAHKDRFSQSLEATETAVRSLEAWEKVKEEIKDNRDDWIKGLDPEWHTYDRCIAIIDKHLKGVSECK